MIEKTKNEFYHSYLRTKKYHLDVVSNTIPHNYYDETLNLLSKYFETYKYIFCKLSDILQEELKYDVIDHLEHLRNIQTATKYKVLFNDFIQTIKNFKGFDDFYVDNEYDLLNFKPYLDLMEALFSKYPIVLERINNGSFAKVLDNILVCNYILKLFFTSNAFAKHTINQKNFILEHGLSENYTGLEKFKLMFSTDDDVLIDCDIIEIYYLKGFKKGEICWEKDYRVPFNQEVSDVYLKRLKFLYYEDNLDNLNKFFASNPYAKGCSFVKKLSFKKISLKGIEWLGFYSALTFNIDKFIKETGIHWTNKTTVENYSNEPYNGLFVVSQKKRIFKTKEGQIKTVNAAEANEYDLLNFNIYDEQTGELLKVGAQHEYNKNFFSKLVKVDPVKVAAFLDYHYSLISAKIEFKKYLDLVVITHKHFESKHKSVKKAVELWLKSNREAKPNSVELSDFFKDDVSEAIILKIQKAFNEETGKRMAIVIYLLDNIFKLTLIDNTSKTKSRKHFVEALTVKKYKGIQSVNSFLQATTGDLKGIRKNDNLFVEIKIKLDKIVSDCSTITNN